MNFGQAAKLVYLMLMAEIKGDDMGKIKDFMIDFLEDVGYEMGYDVESFHTLDKMTVTEYLQKAYTIKDKQRELEIIKMDRENRIRKIVRSEIQNMYNHEEAYLDHLRNSHDQSDDFEAEGEGNNSHP